MASRDLVGKTFRDYKVIAKDGVYNKITKDGKVSNGTTWLCECQTCKEQVVKKRVYLINDKGTRCPECTNAAGRLTKKKKAEMMKLYDNGIEISSIANALGIAITTIYYHVEPNRNVKEKR